jgi:hypothetical protein
VSTGHLAASGKTTRFEALSMTLRLMVAEEKQRKNKGMVIVNVTAAYVTWRTTWAKRRSIFSGDGAGRRRWRSVCHCGGVERA